MAITAYAAQAPRDSLQPFTYEPDALGAFEVELAITHCGVCHSDLHIVNGDWGGAFPVVPGHEIIGIVTQAGTQVAPEIMGKRVGVGWQASACLTCDYCLQGQENLCKQSQAVCFNGHFGGFAQQVRVDSRFCHIIPTALSSENAAPLLCAGITVYAPLRRWARAGHWRVGVVGIGGLGHLGVQFARAMGAEVTAFTTSAGKADEAQTLGAHHVIVTTADNALKQARNTLDFLLVTVDAPLDWHSYARCLRPNGVLCFVGAAENTVNIPVGDILGRQWIITGGSIGGRYEMRDMLAMAALHNITAWTESLPFDQVNTALARLSSNDVRYRFVLTHEASEKSESV